MAMRRVRVCRRTRGQRRFARTVAALPRNRSRLPLEALGYSFQDGEWVPPLAPAVTMQQSALAESDAIHSALVQRADALEGCLEGSEEERELAAITDVIEAYEAKRWPDGKIPGGKG